MRHDKQKDFFLKKIVALSAQEKGLYRKVNDAITNLEECAKFVDIEAFASSTEADEFISSGCNDKVKDFIVSNFPPALQLSMLSELSDVETVYDRFLFLVLLEVHYGRYVGRTLELVLNILADLPTSSSLSYLTAASLLLRDTQAAERTLLVTKNNTLNPLERDIVEGLLNALAERKR
jgi:hypothetical protein